MYSWIFRHLPGPVWLKVIEALIIIAGIVYALFTWTFPWAQEYFHIGDTNVG
ncbi:hypothetical protein I6B53_00215 [Schaalia sp. 19OD2882]|uniref:hypothetical protein n=1 Tax=Schaalia sp. 19OD2882 TaxID=2794089 RepID=UPI001C1EDD1F|nr:hypothetical protein [Schaalia sp. 19OD2882]QWW19611.1 hypothetical protein I6B53_00215 [Schaalia sp. 19OD2882]